MKTLRFFYLLLCGIMLQGLTCWGYAQSPISGYDDFPVPIDEEHFPDEVFRQFVSENYDTDGDGKLSFTEAEMVQNLSLSSMGIESLEGIKYFFPLQYLDCSWNQLMALDVSGCTALETLFCFSNLLTALDLSGCTALDTLNCSSNQLTALDVSGCTALKYLECFSNQLTALDVSGCTALENLDCYENQLTALDVSGCAALVSLDCDENQLTALDVSGCTALKYLDCRDNQLTALDVSGCTALEKLYCLRNLLTALDVSGCAALETLTCSDNQLTALDVSGCTALCNLNCLRNLLTALDVSGCTALETLFCSGNQLTSLDLSANAKLIGFDASDNSLEVVLDGNDAFDLSSLPNFDIDRASDWNGAVLDGNMLRFSQQEVTYQYATAYTGEIGGESFKSVLFTLVADRDPSVGNEAIEDQPQGRVYAKDRTIFTEGLSGEVSVFTTVGTLVYQGQSNRIPVRQAGIYIVRNSGNTWKLLVM